MENSSHFYNPFCAGTESIQVGINSDPEPGDLLGSVGITEDRNVFTEDKLADSTTFATLRREPDRFPQSEGQKNGGPPISEFDEIAQEAEMLVAKQLDSNRTWSKKLIDAIAAYAKTLEEVHSEYSRIQGLEHKEAERLDQVEPDVHGATSHVLPQGSLLASGSANLAPASFPENEKATRTSEDKAQ